VVLATVVAIPDHGVVAGRRLGEDDLPPNSLWFGDSRKDLDEAVLYVLDALPISLCLIVLGATIVYHATRARR
jgi:hypothetical protein